MSTLTLPHCSSNMDSVCSGACTMNHHLVFSPLVLNLRLTRRPDGRLGQSREMAFLIAVTVQLFIVPQILLAPVTLVRLLWSLNREELGHFIQCTIGPLINPRRTCARVTVLVLSVCLSVCVSVCVCVFPILAPRAIRRTNSSISDFSAIRA